MELLNTKCTYQNWSNYEVKGIVLQTAKSTQNLGLQFQGFGNNYKVKGKSLHNNVLTSDNFKFRGFQKPPLGFIIC